MSRLDNVQSGAVGNQPNVPADAYRGRSRSARHIVAYALVQLLSAKNHIVYIESEDSVNHGAVQVHDLSVIKNAFDRVKTTRDVCTRNSWRRFILHWLTLRASKTRLRETGS